ncbi:MAG: beta-lactamase family protein [Spirochaetaceae bacterium]
MKKVILMFCISTLFLLTGCKTSDISYEDVDKPVSMFYRSEKNNFPGCLILVSSNGKIIYKEAFGMQNLENNVLASSDTTFRIGSITKQFTSTAVLLLKERGLLSLTDKLSKYIPDFPKADEVSIYQLLTHTSGIKSYTDEEDFVENVVNYISTRDLINQIKESGYDFEPGTEFRYNNSGYFILGYIIELISGESYGDFLENNIFKPLKMKNTGVYKKGLGLPNEGIGYSYKRGEIKEELNWDMSYAGGAGNLYSDVYDLYLWNEALFNGKVLSKQSLDEAFSPALLLNGENALEHPIFNYGLGWALNYLFDTDVVEHSGVLHGFTASISRMVEEDISIIILTNKSYDSFGVKVDILKTRIMTSIITKLKQE